MEGLSCYPPYWFLSGEAFLILALAASASTTRQELVLFSCPYARSIWDLFLRFLPDLQISNMSYSTLWPLLSQSHNSEAEILTAYLLW